MANASGCMVIERFAKFPSKMKMSGGVHAIQFKTSRNVYLFGVGLSGASGSFTAKVRIMRCLQASAPAKNSKEDIAAEQIAPSVKEES
ncbi:hypothetical protein PRIPAC_81961 [Pristionchus pacificus]|uniref:PHR domain-containing protein n=1 Tax=Pristionchus pacificus TaxID=54126 RepID=A0A2A6CKW5_PRIPA|nr:hypothetical protein PRIPAC_81961 [Pristionchus pacificus]|eukprot:PDM78759.1 hypothetical protein PRIPAC_31338 [Pristionchus pacificus]